MKKITLLTLCIGVFYCVNAQVIDLNKIDLGKITNVNDILGQVLKVKKGFAPKFALGNLDLKKITKVSSIIGLKKNAQATKYFNTFKTGRTIYKVAQYGASALALYGTLKSLDKAALKKDYQGAIKVAVGSTITGLVTKFLTKSASYKAVDIFNGVVKNKIKNIFSIAPATETVGMGLFVKF
jgi:hypothetical protein